MLRQALNRVIIEGVLAETNLNYGSYTRDGKPVEYISGDVKILVHQEQNGVPVDLEIPVSCFAPKTTKSGKPNPSYDSINKVKTTFISIASCGSEEKADKVRISSTMDANRSNGKITMNEYYNQQGKLVSFPRVSASFIAKAGPRYSPKATFDLEFMAYDIKPKVDNEGVELEPKQLEVCGIVPLYGGKVEIVKMLVVNPNVIDAVERYWEKGNTYVARGRLNFTSRTEEVATNKLGFGEGETVSRTVSVSEIIITGGSDTALEGDLAFSMEDISAALSERKASLEALKEKASQKAAKAAPVNKSISLSDLSQDLGF